MSISKQDSLLRRCCPTAVCQKRHENTTMNDIALLSEKGCRTLYTYFKSKEDVY